MASVYVTIALFALLSFQSGIVAFLALFHLSRLRRMGPVRHSAPREPGWVSVREPDTHDFPGPAGTGGSSLPCPCRLIVRKYRLKLPRQLGEIPWLYIGWAFTWAAVVVWWAIVRNSR